MKGPKRSGEVIETYYKMPNMGGMDRGRKGDRFDKSTLYKTVEWKSGHAAVYTRADVKRQHEHYLIGIRSE